MNNRNNIDVVFVAGPPGAGKTSITEEYQKNNPNTEQFGVMNLMRDIRSGRVSSEYYNVIHEAKENGVLVPDYVFSGAMYEKVMNLDNDTEKLMVTGFPYDYSDWKIFNDTIQNKNIHMIGAITLCASMHTCVVRMRDRDIKEGMNAMAVNSENERFAYEKRYISLMGRLAIRLDCYKQSGLNVIPISAEGSRDEVLDSFSEAIDVLKEGAK